MFCSWRGMECSSTANFCHQCGHQLNLSRVSGMKNNKSSTRGLSLEMSVLAKARAQLLNMLFISTHLSVPLGENIQKTVLYIQKLVLSMTRAEWMNGICLIWSRGRLISPSLPVGDDRYLNLISQKRPTGRNLGGNRLVRRSGTTSRGTVVLVFCLRMRSFSLTLVLVVGPSQSAKFGGKVIFTRRRSTKVIFAQLMKNR